MIGDGTRTVGRLPLPAVLVLAGCLGYMVSFVSANLHPRFEYREEVVAQQSALLHRQPLVMFGQATDIPEWRNRVLVPLLMAAGTATGVGTPGEWFLVIRLATAILMFAVFLRAADHGAREWTLLGAALLAYECVLSFNEAWEFPVDYVDVTVMVAACALTRLRRWLPLMLVAVAGATNRESAAFAGVVWTAAWAWREDGRLELRELARGFAISAAAAVVVVGLRSYLLMAPAGGQGIGIRYLPASVALFLAHPQPYGWLALLVGMVAPIAVMGMAGRGVLPRFERRLLAASGVIAVVTLLFGMADELRVFLTPIAIIVYALTTARAAGAGASVTAAT